MAEPQEKVGELPDPLARVQRWPVIAFVGFVVAVFVAFVATWSGGSDKFIDALAQGDSRAWRVTMIALLLVVAGLAAGAGAWLFKCGARTQRAAMEDRTRAERTEARAAIESERVKLAEERRAFERDLAGKRARLDAEAITIQRGWHQWYGDNAARRVFGRLSEGWATVDWDGGAIMHFSVLLEFVSTCPDAQYVEFTRVRFIPTGQQDCITRLLSHKGKVTPGASLRERVHRAQLTEHEVVTIRNATNTSDSRKAPKTAIVPGRFLIEAKFGFSETELGQPQEVEVLGILLVDWGARG